MNKQRKIIFLDHNGVMYIKKHPCPGYLDLFDKNKIILLNKILHTIKDVEIVVSSDWRFWVNLATMKQFYIQQGIQPPVDYTTHVSKPYYGSMEHSRAHEINNWLKKNGDVTHWVAIDDLDMTPYLSNFVKTNYSFNMEINSDNESSIGLTLENINSILKYLI